MFCNSNRNEDNEQGYNLQDNNSVFRKQEKSECAKINCAIMLNLDKVNI